MTDEPTTLRRILRELPRRRVALIFALVFVVVVLNVFAVVSERGRQIAVERSRNGNGPSYCFGGPIPPWEWTAEEWRETWPWK